jgi:hypothetical protein
MLKIVDPNHQPETSMLSKALHRMVIASDSYYLGPTSRLMNGLARVWIRQEALNAMPDHSLTLGALVVLVRTKIFLRSGVRPATHEWLTNELLVGRLRDFESQEVGAKRTDPDHEAIQMVVDFELLGRFHLNEDGIRSLYSNDIGHILGPSNWHIFLPSPEILNFILNGTLGTGFKVNFGRLRRAESDFTTTHSCPVNIHVPDIRGKRTAMFGKTRLGKSNAVKLVLEGMMAMTAKDKKVGQLVFDVNGEYANDNPQDGNTSIATMYQDRCQVYYLAQRPPGFGMGPNRKYIRYNFFERTRDCNRVMSELLGEHHTSNEDLQFFLQMQFPDFLDFVTNEEPSHQSQRVLRKIHLMWTALSIAGFPYSESHLLSLTNNRWRRNDLFATKFSNNLRMAMYQAIEGRIVPHPPSSMEELVKEMLVYCKFIQQYNNDPNLLEMGVSLVDKDDTLAARFIAPEIGPGPKMLSSCMPYHSDTATDFENDIIHALDDGQTIIMDLGSANETVLRFFSRTLSVAVFRHQEAKFVTNQLSDRYIQLYFEEAHMIFPPSEPGKVTDIYSRFAKEGAKFHIGIVYSTQSPSTVNPELLSQTENFFIGHLSNANEVALLGKVQCAYANMGDYIMRYRQPGFMHMLTYSHRFVVPVQVRVFSGENASQKFVIGESDDMAH